MELSNDHVGLMLKTLHFRQHFLFELAPRSIRVEQGRSSFLLELKGSDEEHSRRVGGESQGTIMVEVSCGDEDCERWLQMLSVCA